MNDRNPLVSIVMATYNGERFLKEQLDSLLNQTYDNIEIIAVDDCSTDNTVSILHAYAARHQNIHVVCNEQNLGYVKNFEKGFNLAKGDYISPCDQDDIWLPHKVEVLHKHIGDYAIAYGNSDFIDIDGQRLGEKMNSKKTLANFNSPLMYVLGGSAPGHAMLIKKQIVLNAMPFPTIVSHDLWLGFVATFHSSLNFVNEVLVLYRRHDANVFGSLHKKDKRKNNPKGNTKERIEKARLRIKLLYEECPANLMIEKEVFKKTLQKL